MSDTRKSPSPRSIAKREAKMQRLENANALLRVIAAHGRRFFYSPQYDRVARLELDPRGVIWFVDHYTDKRVYVSKTGFSGSRWDGFTSGGTLRSLVEDLRDYISSGQLLHRGVIAPMRLREADGNIWGYDVDSARIVREQAYELPLFAAKN
ncbi:hypothetical protein D3C71_25090 [compost metagenome]